MQQHKLQHTVLHHENGGIGVSGCHRWHEAWAGRLGGRINGNGGWALGRTEHAGIRYSRTCPRLTGWSSWGISGAYCCCVTGAAAALLLLLCNVTNEPIVTSSCTFDASSTVERPRPTSPLLTPALYQLQRWQCFEEEIWKRRMG